MLPFGIGLSEILVIGVVLLIVVGPQRLPEIAKVVGKGLRTARKASDEIKSALSVDELKRDIHRHVYEEAWRPTTNAIDDVFAGKDGVFSATEDAETTTTRKGPPGTISRVTTRTDVATPQAREDIAPPDLSSLEDNYDAYVSEDDDEDDDDADGATPHEGTNRPDEPVVIAKPKGTVDRGELSVPDEPSPDADAPDGRLT